MSSRSQRAHRSRAKSTRISVPKAFTPGVAITTAPGEELRVALLGATADELFGVELVSGAYVRIDRIDNDANPKDHNEISNDQLDNDQLGNCELDDDGQDVHNENQSRQRRVQSFVPHVISCVPRANDPVDPGRPEALYLTGPPTRLAPLRPRQLKRLTRAVVAYERQGALILESRAPSLSYGELTTMTESVVLIATDSKRVKLMASLDGSVTLTLRWGGITQSLPVSDFRSRAAANAHPGVSLYGEALVRALGYKPGFALIALDRVHKGYVRKIVVGLLAR